MSTNDNAEPRLQLGLAREHYDNLAVLGEVNWSTLRKFSRSPAHYRYLLDHPESNDSDLFTRNIAGHVAALEPTRYGGTVYDASDAALRVDGGLYSVWPEANGKRGTKAWDAADADCNRRGVRLLRQKDHEWCVAISTAVHACPAAVPLLKGDREVTLRWSEHVDAMGGAAPFAWKLRGRVDLLGPDAIVDLKATRDASIDGFMRQVAMYSYHGQAAVYRDGLKRITGKSLPYFWIAVENDPPHVVTVFEASDQVLARGREIYWEYLYELRTCIERGVFPPYATGIVRGAELPKWAQAFDDEQLDDTEQLGPTPRVGF